MKTVQEAGWGRLKNGELLRVAEGQFDMMVTADQRLQYQQDLAARNLAIVVLPTHDWTILRRMEAAIARAVECSAPGTFQKVPVL